MKKEFLLKNRLAESLYFETASKLPIIDYHNHLPIADLVENRKFDSLYSLWLECDPYKHRAMRMCGIEEEYITGNAFPYEKFRKWADILPHLVGNPLYHWSAMELSYVFGIDIPLNGDTCREIWDNVNSKLSDDAFSANGILKRFNVEYIAPCTCIADDLSPFENISDFAAPSLRGDDMVHPTNGFLHKLESLKNGVITDLDSYCSVLKKRIAEFDRAGCRFSDHAVDDGFVYFPDEDKANSAFSRILKGEDAGRQELDALSSVVLKRLGCVYSDFGWTMQLHIGALRKTSDRLRHIAGPAGGYAAISSTFDVRPLAIMLNDIERTGGLPKTLLFTLNPAYNAVMSVLSGSFSGESGNSLISQGPAWWWCDHIKGIKDVLENISTFGVLSEFIGMTTDSRSILSFVRHDYFRRVLCSWMAEKAVNGEFPDDIGLLGYIAENVCYKNAERCIR